MRKEDIVAMGVAEDIAEKIAAASAEELKGFIPKSRFDEVNEAKKNAEALVRERDGQLGELKKTAGASEELLKKIGDLEASNKEAAKAYEARIRDMTLDAAIKDKLSGTQYVDLLMPRVDRSKLEIAADGTVSGIEEQVAGLKAQYKDLFAPGVTGRGEGSQHGSFGAGAGTPAARRAELEKTANDTSLPLATRIAAKNQLFNFKED